MSVAPRASSSAARASDEASSPAAVRVMMVSRRVHPAHGPGGLERHVHDLVQELAGRGIPVDLFTETPASTQRLRALTAAMPDSVVVHFVPDRWLPFGRPGTVVLDRITNYPLWARRVAGWAARAGLPANERARAGRRASRPPDGKGSVGRAADDGGTWVIHAHGLAGLGFPGAGAPVILSPHGMEEFQTPTGLKRWAYAPFRACMRSAAAHSAAVIAMDRSLGPLIERFLRVPPERQVLIPNAVRADELERRGDPVRGREIASRLGADPAGTVLLSVGRVAPNKGYDVLLGALHKVGASLQEPWTWILVGDGPLLPRLKEAAAGLAGNVGFAGAVGDDQLHDLYAAADWFVHPTLYEGSSIVTLEAMAHGLPVIASSTGGLPDKVEEGVTGFLVTPGDVEALAAVLLRLAAADAVAMGQAGRRLCRERFAWSAVGRQYVELYRSLAA